MTDKFIHMLKNYGPEAIQELNSIYTNDVQYEDPINKGKSLAHLKLILEDLLKVFKGIQFESIHSTHDDEFAFVSWKMRYKFRNRDYQIDGVSRLRFNGSGQITEHKDYWDASFPLYGTFPIIGLIMKLIKKFVSVKEPSLKSDN
ncbi:MAG: nuclear transport factor 2 family protein [Verrucomicrobiales bacterium]